MELELIEGTELKTYLDSRIDLIIRSTHLLNDEFEIVDYKLRAFGDNEDKILMGDSELRHRLRRGNSFLVQRTTNSVEILRRGMKKFFDLDLSSEMDDLKILYQESERGVTIYLTPKLNGENVQISYSRLFEGWVVCSKNVSLVAGKAEDLARYQD